MNRTQFRAILWLRWRLSRNQLLRGSGVGAAIAALAVVLLVLLAVGAGVGATLLGVFALKKASATELMFIWDGVVFFVLFFSLIAVLTELQRSESVDLTKLLHLPIGLNQVFVFNYLASLISLGTVLALAVMLGLVAGMVISRGGDFLLAIPLVLAFVFMFTAWIYCLRGWLLSLMVNPRRRRAMIVWITLGVILIGQSPQLIHFVVPRKAARDRAAQSTSVTNSAAQPAETPSATRGALPPQEAQSVTASKREKKNVQVLAVATGVNQWLPLLWLPNGMRGLAAGSWWPALWGGAGMFALGWLGLSRAYRATLKFYRGEERAKPVPAKPVSTRAARPAANWIERSLPGLPDDTAALAWTQFRSMLRAPEVRMMLAMGLFVAIFLPAIILWRGGSSPSFPEAVRPFIGTGMMVMVLFTLMQLVCNQFGCDRDGFRGLVLLPTRRERLLLGKNVALFPLAGAIMILPLVAVSVLAKLSLLVVLATLLQFAAAFLLYCAIGNLASILVPYRIAAGSLKPTKQSWQTSLGVMVVHLSFPLLVSPVFIPPALGFGLERLSGWPAGPVNCCASLVLAFAFGAVYKFTLPPLGRLLQRRETNILRAVTEVRE